MILVKIKLIQQKKIKFIIMIIIQDSEYFDRFQRKKIYFHMIWNLIIKIPNI